MNGNILFPGLGVAVPADDQARHFAANRDRVLLTLLALNLMLMAFFVVLNSAAKIDPGRATATAQSVSVAAAEIPVSPPRAADQIPRSVAAEDVRQKVAQVFAAYIAQPSPLSANEERIDVAVPALALSDEMLDGVASIVAKPPAGYRIDLVVQGAVSEERALAGLAARLVGSGIAAQSLSVGVGADAAAPRFTFFLLGVDAEFAALPGMLSAGP